MERSSNNRDNKINKLMEEAQSNQHIEENYNGNNIQNWVAKSKKRMILKYSMLFLGIITIISSIPMTFALIDQGLIVFLVIPLIIFSFILISKYFNLAPYSLKENSLSSKKPGVYREPILESYNFISIASSRLIAGLMLIIIGIINLIMFGYSIGAPTDEIIGTYIGTGTWAFLGGLSFFYPIGLPPLIIGIGLILYRFISSFWGRFSISENLFFFHEIRHIRPWLTEIRRKDVEGHRFQNNQTGPKVIWIIIFIPIIFLTLQFGLSIFNHPLAEEQTLPVLMTVTGIIDLIAMLILILYPQYYIEMVTKDQYYEMWLNPLDYNTNIKRDLGNLLNGKVEKIGKDRKIDEEIKINNSNQSSKQSDVFIEKGTRSYFRLCYGLLILIISLISGSFYVLYGTLFFLLGGIYGTIIIYQALFNDFNKESKIEFNNNTKELEMTRLIHFRRKFQKITLRNAEKFSFEDYPRKIEITDIIFGFSISIVIIINTVWGLLFTDYSAVGSILDLIASLIICMLILTMIFIYFCVPTRHLKLKSNTITYRIKWGIERNKENKDKLAKISRDTINLEDNLKPTEDTKENKKIFILRAIILLSIFTGSIILAIGII